MNSRALAIVILVSICAVGARCAVVDRSNSQGNAPVAVAASQDKIAIDSHTMPRPQAPPGPSSASSPGAGDDAGLSDQADAYSIMESKFQGDVTESATDELKAIQQVQYAFASPLLKGTRLDAVQCRRSLCRIVATSQNRRADHLIFVHVFGQRAEPLLAWGGSYAARNRVINPDGSITVTIYAGRGTNVLDVGR